MQVVVVSGSRKLKDREAVWSRLDMYLEDHDRQPLLIMHGDCWSGADYFASEWVRDRSWFRFDEDDENWPDIFCHPVPAEWKRYGPTAGPIRNHLMLALSLAYEHQGHKVVCETFPEGGPGTRDFIRKARMAELKVLEWGQS